MLEKLKELLESGAITQAEFDEMAKNIKASEADPEENPEAAPEDNPKDNFDKVFQSKFDKAMARERKEKADLKKQLERLQKKILTDEETKQFEFEEQQRELEEQRKELAREKNKMYAVKAMRKAEMSDNEETIALIERLVASCEDETEIDATIALLKAWHSKSVKADVDKRFRDGGYTPRKSTNMNGGNNPYTKEQFSLTEQMSLEINNPELAAQLKAAAGIK